MKTIITERVLHKGESRIALKFQYDAELISLVKKIPDIRWSKTMCCWHVPDNAISFERLSDLLRSKAIIDLSGITKSENAAGKAENIILNGEPGTSFHLPDIVPNEQRRHKINQRAEAQNDSHSIREGYIESDPGWNDFSPVEFTLNEADGKLIVRFTGKYDRDWIRELKSYGRITFDPVRLEWILGWSGIIADSLSDYFSSRGVGVIIKKAGIAAKVKEQRDGESADIRNRFLPEEILKGIENTRRFLIVKRYSGRTIEAYVSMLELFFKYFSGKDPLSISEEDISDFFNDYIIYHRYSASYHSQLISAIKMYYQVNGSHVIDSSSLVRPRRGRALPKVFSKEEIKSILNASRNIKHRLILWLIYSCGLRRSELINIRLQDLDRPRGLLNIRQAKGMNDRIVPVSEKVWEKVDEYIGVYRPEFWLIEGQNGGRYSVESVYNVFKQALQGAGIKKDVGVHSLRHSYATHLHENGVDIRYIQELLGHKSSRTTEIYTHVSRRNLVAVRSPIEDLDLK
jgi:integrase/recombinase XerD